MDGNSEDSQIYSIFQSKNSELKDPRAITQYKYINASELNLEERVGKNLASTIKMDPELNIEGKPNYLMPLEPSAKSISYKSQLRASNLRRKSKLSELRLKEKEEPIPNFPLKSKSFKVNTCGAIATPIGIIEKAQNTEQTLANIANQKSPSSSLVFIKGNIEAMKKANSYPINETEENEEPEAKFVNVRGERFFTSRYVCLHFS